MVWNLWRQLSRTIDEERGEELSSATLSLHSTTALSLQWCCSPQEEEDHVPVRGGWVEEPHLLQGVVVDCFVCGIIKGQEGVREEPSGVDDALEARETKG